MVILGNWMFLEYFRFPYFAQFSGISTRDGIWQTHSERPRCMKSGITQFDHFPSLEPKCTKIKTILDSPWVLFDVSINFISLFFSCIYRNEWNRRTLLRTLSDKLQLEPGRRKSSKIKATRYAQRFLAACQNMYDANWRELLDCFCDAKWWKYLLRNVLWN